MPVKKITLKKTAIELRRMGLSYSDINKSVNVSRSTLSVWLRNVPLSTKQKRELTARRPSNNGAKSSSESAKAKRVHWLQRATDYFLDVNLDYSSLALVGAALYWAEGNKYGVFKFANSDPEMVQIYLRWLREILIVNESDIRCHVNVYLDTGKSLNDVLSFWRSVTKVSSSKFYKTTINSAPKRSKGTKVGRSVYGTVSISMCKAVRYLSALAALLAKLGKDVQYVTIPPSKKRK
jgi:hypothetical protein